MTVDQHPRGGAVLSAAPPPRRPDQASPGPALALRGLVKRYGEITAVNGLDLDIAPGTCLGLLGPNGAGKSTTMRMLTGQTRADAGEITVLGYQVPRESKQARALMGVVPQLDNLDEELTAEQNLDVFAHLYRVPAAERRAAVERALAMVGLADRAGTRTDKLSGGMRRRLLIARGLVHGPRLVLLDEPTVGLDPQVRQELWSLIDALRSDGVTVLMSTHYIEEAERLADDVAIMSQGRVIARGSPAELLEAHAGRLAVEFYGPPGRLVEIEEIAAGAGLPTRRTGPSVSVLRAEDLPARTRDRLGEGNERASNLEDVFVVLTGETVQ
jgi:lipooligosaccharide transport system ATP-binding protein